MEFRTLTNDEIELRVGATTAKGFSLLLYKNARCDMQLLDEVVGSMNWMREHSRDNANCIVSIWDGEKKEWVSKEDTGTESQTEKEKGLASDSFKRACVNWGIGRELYTAPFIWISGHVDADSRARSGYKADQRFVGGLKVSAIEYNNKRSIKKLVIEDEGGNIVYSYGTKRKPNTEEKVSPKKNAPKEEPKKAEVENDSIIFAEHAQDIKDGLEETDSNVSAFLSLFQAKSVDEMYESQYEKAMQMIEKKRQKLKGGN